MLFTRARGLTVIAVAAASVSLPGQEPSLATVMERASGYATTFRRQLSNIVAEEWYVQDIRRLNLPPGRFAAESHRELRSDVLLVQPGGTDRYVEFRDVFEVDGKPVRDRQDRLTALFLDPTRSAEAQIQRINQESARYNIGNIQRTINTPTLPLLFLSPENQSRFRFTRGTRNAPALARSAAAPRGAVTTSFTAPADAWVVEYEEIQRPTLIRTTQGMDLPARGRFWTEPATGRVLMSELITDEPIVRATIDVRYQWDPQIALLVPGEMRERYEGRRDGAVIEGSATYGHIRQFQVRADQRLATGPQRQTERADVAAVDHPTGPPIPDPVPDDVGITEAGKRTQDPAPVAAPTAQDPPKPPAFAAGTELVLVDFVVSDKADRLVRGLSAKDFVVKEDGKERPIVTFEAFAGDAPSTATAHRVAPGPAVRAASPSTQASTVVLVDDGQLSPQQSARLRPAIRALLAAVAEPSGTLMVVAPESRVSVAGAIPASAADIAAAADRIAGQRVEEPSNVPMSDGEALDIARGELPPRARVAARFAALNPELTPEQADVFARELANKVAHDARARRNVMYDAVLVCLDWLASRAGRHSLIVVSAGFAQDPDDSKYYEVVTRSLRANAPIHFLDARGLQGIGAYKGAEYGTLLDRNADEGPFGWSQAAGGSMALADETGGLTISNSNDMAKGLGRLLGTMTTYYVLAYQPPAHDKPGYRRIRVEVRGKGLQVRARRGYFSGAPAAR